jgi:hypothetical protein
LAGRRAAADYQREAAEKDRWVKAEMKKVAGGRTGVQRRRDRAAQAALEGADADVSPGSPRGSAAAQRKKLEQEIEELVGSSPS